ncbi:MAG TPA: DUF488 domain-containing protein [Balneolales bacterium]|nr:DUF488 domain-containing protein [Balneolales bacterium]
MKIRTKRVYDDPEDDDGHRYLVDRLWPRGMKKEALKMDGWLKSLAPSTELRKWFHHDSGKWDEFKSRYFEELAKQPEAWQTFIDENKDNTITLLYAAKDREHNQALVLKEFLLNKMKSVD